jgi:hypothetical protein
MDAVVFMEAINRPVPAGPPPPQPKRQPRMSSNASLIAGIATLVLAIGVGVLIGRSGDSGTTTAASAPQIIKVGGGAAETASAGPVKESDTAKKSGAGTSKTKKAGKGGTDTSGTSEAAAEVLKPSPDVKLPPPTVQPGSKCESGAAGCKGGEFTGEFFGE